MTPFPPIQRTCPYLDRLDAVIDAGFCSMCRRDVHDLTGMDARARASFLTACGGDACVSYTMNVKPALAASLIAASAAVLAVPDPALAEGHQLARSHHRSAPARVSHVPIMVVGGIAPVDPPPRPAT